MSTENIAFHFHQLIYPTAATPGYPKATYLPNLAVQVLQGHHSEEKKRNFFGL